MVHIRWSRSPKRRVLALVLAAVAFVAASVGPVPRANAFTAATFFQGVWSASARKNVAIYRDPSLPTAAMSRVLDAAKTWENLHRSLNFTSMGTRTLSHNACDVTQRGLNVIVFGPLDGKGKNLAETSTCRSSGQLVRFVTTFDSAENWYTGTSKDVPYGRPDLWSVATHEMGHAAGWGPHFDDVAINLGLGICGDISGQQTMCKTHYSGTARQRSLGPHDVDTFEQMY